MKRNKVFSPKTPDWYASQMSWLSKREERQKVEVEKQKAKELKAQKAPSKRKTWNAYKRQVWAITELQPIQTLPHYHARGYQGYHLDHKVSIWHGWKHNLPAEWIGDIANLRFIPHRLNMLKGVRSVSNDLQAMINRLSAG